MGAPALLLFDIDGTVLRGAADDHREALHAALQSVYGLADPSAVHLDLAGRTDLEIGREILVRSNVPAERFYENATEYRVRAAEEYAQRCPADLTDRQTPGIAHVLEELHARADVQLALVTGNLEPIARLKLKRAGLGHFFARGQGGFGSDDEDRAALPGLARERAGSPGRPHPPERTWVIGDTPRDIACARADGVRCLAIATGPYPPEQLHAADGVATDADQLYELIRGEIHT